MSILARGSATVLGQRQIATKSNDVARGRNRPNQSDLTNTLFTADAMRTQTGTSEHIVASGGAHLTTIKANQPGLLG